MQKNFNQNRKKAISARLNSTRLKSARLAKQAGRRGFSFLEVMLVVFILGTALTVFTQVIASSFSHSAASRDTIIAAGLAQEGVELVRNLRDNNWANDKDAFEDKFPADGNNYRISYDNINMNNGSKAFNLKDGFYSHSGGSATKFSRKIAISTSGETRKVTSYVIWGITDFPATCDISNKCVYAEIVLTKWGD